MRLIALLSLVFSVGCAALPPRPSITLCLFDSANLVAYCAPTNGVSSIDEARTIFDMPRSLDSIPASELDNYVMMSPDDYKKTLDYIESIKKLAKQCR